MNSGRKRGVEAVQTKAAAASFASPVCGLKRHGLANNGINFLPWWNHIYMLRQPPQAEPD